MKRVSLLTALLLLLVALALLSACESEEPTTTTVAPVTTLPSEAVTTPVATTPAVTTTEPPAPVTTDPIPSDEIPLPDFASVNSIPKADQSSVGQVVQLHLDTTSFYYFHGERSRLITVEAVPDADYGQLVIYRPRIPAPEFLVPGILCSGGVQLDAGIQGEVLAVAHITLEECAQLMADLADLAQLAADEYCRADSAPAAFGADTWYFSIHDSEDDRHRIDALAGNTGAQQSPRMAYQVKLINHVLTRYDLVRALYDADQPLPPGTLVAADSLPKADQSSVGQTVKLSIPALMDKVMFLVLDKDAQTARLMVLEPVPEGNNLAMITVYEPLPVMSEWLMMTVSAKVLAVSYITHEEYLYAKLDRASADAYIDAGSLWAEELIPLSSDIDHPGNQQWYCTVFGENGKISDLLTDRTEQNSQVLDLYYQCMEMILYRYDLGMYQ